MLKKLPVLCHVLLIFSLVGCASIPHPFRKTAKDANATSMPPYSGPKARLAVADFDVKAAKARGEIGSGLREMLVTALTNSNRFSVVDRQALAAMMQEKELAASEAAGQGSSKKDKIKAADLIITAAVTEFEPQGSGGRAGVGGGGGVSEGAFGGLLGAAVNKAHMALDIRIVNASTSDVLASTKVQGQASDVAGHAMIGSMGSWPLGAGLSAYANTPMEKAIRICIIEAVRYLSQRVPADYYKY